MTQNKGGNSGGNNPGGSSNKRAGESSNAPGAGGRQGNPGRGDDNSTGNLSQEDRAKGGERSVEMKDHDKRGQFARPVVDTDETDGDEGGEDGQRRSSDAKSGSRSGGPSASGNTPR